jgi:DMSO reductase anchor subunit
MHPAYSVILFTSASGAGYGLIIWLAIARLGDSWELDPVIAIAFCGAALGLITLGLMSSTFHLGHPERAWRAFSQWRSSWLSREGVFAVLAYPPALIFSAGWLWTGVGPGLMQVAAAATVVLALLTVYCTGMIYASLKTIPRWSNPLVVPVYLLFALATGGLLFALALALSGEITAIALFAVLAVLAAGWFLKQAYWRYIDRQKPVSDTGTATGLGHLGRVRQLEAPHTSENYLLKEMGYAIARKHAGKLRRMALNLGFSLPGILLITAAVADGMWPVLLIFLALLTGLTGVVVERWLFFAEARHAVTLYYGGKSL